MESLEEEKVLFPTEAEVKSYFPDEVWNAMSEYERKTYQNLLHNYNVMRFLDLRPVKPSFMTLYQKKANKRKVPSNPCPVPVKKFQPPIEKPPKKVQHTKQLRKSEQKKVNVKKAGQQKTEQKKTPLFTSNHKWKSISLQCTFAAVFQVYKRYHGIIKGHYPRKQKTLKVSKKYVKKTEEKQIEKIEKGESINIGQEANVEGSEIGEAKDEIQVIARDDSKGQEETKVSTNDKGNKCVKSVAEPQKKPVCRSVQTMTVADGGSPLNSALVFINAASSKKSSVVFPDPKPLTPKEQKIAKKINQEKMKNRRNVQTQTASESSSIEESSLVFFPMPKPKKPKQPPPSSQSDPSKKVSKSDKTVSVTDVDKTASVTDADKVASDIDANVAGGPSPLEQPDNKTKVTDAVGNDAAKNKTDEEDEFGFYTLFNQKSDKGATVTTAAAREAVRDRTDASSEDEFGFYAMFGGKHDAPATKSSTSKPQPRPQPVDPAVPGCSFWPSPRGNRAASKSTTTEPSELSDEDEFGFAQIERERRRYPRRAVPVVNYTEAELLKDDEYLFCDLCDREYEGDCPEHGPHTFFPDRFVPVTGDDKRAIETTPAMLKVDKSKIPGAGSGVWTKYGVPPHIVKDKRVHHYVAAHSTATSNWMRFVNCARHETEQNLMAFQFKGQMFYRTVKLIPPKAELFVWYGKEYAEMLGISMESFRSKDTSHLRNLVFPCNKCNVTYTSPLYLEAHGRRCRGERAAVRVEPSQVPTDVQTLAVVVDGRKTYCCNLCSYKTTHCSHMKNHIMTHSRVMPHHCDVCGKGFTRASHLNTHKRIHTGDKPYKCSQCSFSCSDSSSLSKHMTRHTGEKAYACPECDYKTAVSGDMERHSRTHSRVKPYSCTLCQYRAARSSALTSHMRTHTGEKPHACPHCQYRAATSSNLTVHMRTHTGEKPHSCPHCEYRTTHSSALTSHMRTHTGEKPYTCPHCQYRTAWKGEFNKHINRKHPTQQ